MAAHILSKLSAAELKTFTSSFDTVLTDCDGVLWEGNTPLPNSPQAINALRAMGKKIFFVTNNSTKSRDEYMAKFQMMGINAEKDEILSSSYLTACYLKDLNFNKKVYVVGSKGVTQELDMVGISHCGLGPDVMTCDVPTLVLSNKVDLDDKVGAVVVGFDEHFSYPKILRASSYLKNPDCMYVATNLDPQFPSSSGLVVPGTGSLVSAVTTAAGREPTVMGKPSPYAFQCIQKKYQLNPQRTLMIGDRANTDILFGSVCGLQTLLVLSGITKLEEVNKWKISENNLDKQLVPNYVLPTLGDMLSLLGA